MNNQPATAGNNEQEALTPREWLNWLVGSLSILLATHWPLAIQRLTQLTGRTLPQPPAGASANYLPKIDIWDLDQPLLKLSPTDTFTLRNAYEGIISLGSIGAGKSSGSLKTIAHALLSHGFGMLILTSSPEERTFWQELTQQTGRADDLIVIGQRANGEVPYRFNPIDYEGKAGGNAVSLTENIITLMTQTNDIISGKESAGDHENQFFSKAQDELLRATVTALLLADYPVTLDNVRNMINSGPQTTLEADSDKWIDDSFCGQVLNKAHTLMKDKSNPQAAHDLAVSSDYWTIRFARLHEKTRTSVTATVTGNIDVLSYGIAHQMLATDTTITPDAALKDRKILLLDVSVQQYQEVGKVIQSLWKLSFQRAALRRDTAKYPHGVALIADEAHYFASDYDSTFQSVARRARCCHFILSQNISQFYDKLGEDKTHALFGNFVNKVFHSQSCTQTNHYASELIGKHWKFVSNYSSSRHGLDPETQSSGGGSEQLIYKLENSSFTTLRKGGPPDFEVDAVMFQGGRIFNTTGDTFMPIVFKQTF